MGETIRLQGLLQGCAPRSDLDRLQLLADQTRMQLEASRGELQGELDRTHAELAVCRLREAALEAKIGQAAASATQEVDMVAARVQLELVEASLADARASAVRLGEELALVREGSVPKVQYESLLARCERLEAMHKQDLEASERLLIPSLKAQLSLHSSLASVQHELLNTAAKEADAASLGVEAAAAAARGRLAQLLAEVVLLRNGLSGSQQQAARARQESMVAQELCQAMRQQQSSAEEVHQRSTELDQVADALRHCSAALTEAERERDEATEEAALLHQVLGAARKEIEALKEELMAAHTEKGSLSNAVSSLAAALAFTRLQAGAHAEGSDQPPPEHASKSATSNPVEILTGERGLLRLLEWQLRERAAAEDRAATSSGSISLAASASPQSSGRAPPAASAPPQSPSQAFLPPLEDQGLRAAANDLQEPEELKQLAGGGRWNDRGCSGSMGHTRDLWASMGLSASTVGTWPSKPSLVSATHTA